MKILFVILLLCLLGCSSDRPVEIGKKPPEKIDREGIRKVFFTNQRSIRACYEKGLKKNKDLKGIVKLQFDIGEQGQVLSGEVRKESSMNNPEVNTCLISLLKTLYFPKPPTNQVVNVIYPMAFAPK